MVGGVLNDAMSIPIPCHIDCDGKHSEVGEVVCCTSSSSLLTCE